MKTYTLAACIAALSITTGASALTREVARKCDALLAKTFPPRQIGNPAAGSTKGNGRDEQKYYRKCVANGGNMDESAGK